MTISVIIGTSVDGFIARPTGDLDWLPEGGGDAHGKEGGQCGTRRQHDSDYDRGNHPHRRPPIAASGSLRKVAADGRPRERRALL